MRRPVGEHETYCTLIRPQERETEFDRTPHGISHHKQQAHTHTHSITCIHWRISPLFAGPKASYKRSTMRSTHKHKDTNTHTECLDIVVGRRRRRRRCYCLSTVAAALLCVHTLHVFMYQRMSHRYTLYSTYRFHPHYTLSVARARAHRFLTLGMLRALTQIQWFCST